MQSTCTYFLCMFGSMCVLMLTSNPTIFTVHSLSLVGSFIVCLPPVGWKHSQSSYYWRVSLCRVIQSNLINVTTIKRVSKKLSFNTLFVGQLGYILLSLWIEGVNRRRAPRVVSARRQLRWDDSYVGKSPFKKWVGAGLVGQSPSQLTWSRCRLNPAILSF